MQELELRLQLHVALTRNDDERAILLQQQIDAIARAAGGAL